MSHTRDDVRGLDSAASRSVVGAASKFILPMIAEARQANAKEMVVVWCTESAALGAATVVSHPTPAKVEFEPESTGKLLLFDTGEYVPPPTVKCEP